MAQLKTVAYEDPTGPLPQFTGIRPCPLESKDSELRAHRSPAPVTRVRLHWGHNWGTNRERPTTGRQRSGGGVANSTCKGFKVQGRRIAAVADGSAGAENPSRSRAHLTAVGRRPAFHKLVPVPVGRRA
jgi:hypothetical protein